jgi:hypothetical protein
LEADGLRSSLSGAQTRFERGQALLHRRRLRLSVLVGSAPKAFTSLNTG